MNRFLIGLKSRFFAEPLFLKVPLLKISPLVTPDGLVLFAAEHEGKTEEPTERKKQKEREKGRVPKSPEIPSSLVTIGALLTIFVLSGWLMERFFKIFQLFLGNFNGLPEISVATLEPLFMSVIRELGYILGPIILIGFIMAAVGNIAQVGFLFTLKPLKFDLTRIKLTPANMMRKIFFSKQVAFNLIKTIAKVAPTWLLSVISVIYSDFLSVLKMGSLGVGNSLKTLGFIGFKLALVLTAVLLAIAIPDYFYQKHEFTENIKMTKARGKRRAQRNRRGPSGQTKTEKRGRWKCCVGGCSNQVKKADVVITNPIHFRCGPALRPGTRKMLPGFWPREKTIWRW